LHLGISLRQKDTAESLLLPSDLHPVDDQVLAVVCYEPVVPQRSSAKGCDYSVRKAIPGITGLKD